MACSPPKTSCLLWEPLPTAVLPLCKTPVHAIHWTDTITTAVGQWLGGKKAKHCWGKEKKKNWHKVHCTYCTLSGGRQPTLAPCQVYNKTKHRDSMPQLSWEPEEEGGCTGMTEMVHHNTRCMANIIPIAGFLKLKVRMREAKPLACCHWWKSNCSKHEG